MLKSHYLFKIMRGFDRLLFNFATTMVRNMFQLLKVKWQVSAWQLLLIMCVFAITGTTTAFLSIQLKAWMGLDADTAWYWHFAASAGVLIFGYQAILLLVAFFLGQLRFFWRYEKSLLTKLGILKSSK